MDTTGRETSIVDKDPVDPYITDLLDPNSDT